MNISKLIKELKEWEGTYFDTVYVKVNGKEYRIEDVLPDCEAVVDPSDPDLREEENYRIVLEVGECKQ